MVAAGEFVGDVDGCAIGDMIGVAEGCAAGDSIGKSVGNSVGNSVGKIDGWLLDEVEGEELGGAEGMIGTSESVSIV